MGNLRYKPAFGATLGPGPGGTPLPKRLLRPFLVPESIHAIDDKQFVLQSNDDPTDQMQFAQFGGLVMGATFAFMAIVNGFKDPVLLLVTLAFLGLAGWGWQANRKTPPSRFDVLDRENGTVRFLEWRLAGGGCLEAPWEEFSGRITTSSRQGIPIYHLRLTHDPTLRGFELSESVEEIETLLRKWSFVVQYMDKEGALPDVHHLENYPNRTPGLGYEWEWEYKQHERPDPYYVVWMTELAQKPELDTVYTAIKQRRELRKQRRGIDSDTHN